MAEATLQPLVEPHVEHQSELAARLEWLMFFRVVIVTVLLGSSVVFRLSDQDLFNARRVTLLAVIIGTYVLTIIYAFVLRNLRTRYDVFAYFQVLVDMLLSTVLVGLTGGTESFFLVLFSLCVLSASILLYRRGAMWAMLVATMLIVLLVAREAMGWWLPRGPVTDEALLSVFLSGLTNVSAVFLVGMLAGYLSEQVRDAGQRLIDASRNIEALKALNGHIITSIQSGLVSCTLDHRIIFFNPAAERITGYASEQVLYGRATDLFPSIVGKQIDDDLARWEGQYRRPDGQFRNLGYSLSPLLDGRDQHQGWILILQDLTPLREMEESVRRSERFAAIGKMAAGIAHEIRNPLASMSGSIQMLAASDSLDMTGNRLMRIVLRETDRLNALVTEFLQFARPNPPKFESVQLKRILDELVLVFSYLHFTDEDIAQKLNIDVDLHMDAEVTLDADPRQIRQVFWNLLNNGVQAMAEDGIISVDVELRQREVEVRIQDQGCGIAPDKLDRIFDPFYSTKQNGTGLGLALVHRIVEEHEGRIHVASEMDTYTRFSVILQLKQRPRKPMHQGVSA
ncbi:MAG: ATP-binding protein [Myxococcota bacterium]|nr:ATP-binding protein [Myxococcota bacterium]